MSLVNKTLEEVNEDTRDEYLAQWEITTLSSILAFTLVGNIFVLFALYLRRYSISKKKLTRMYFFIIHLSIADLLTGLFSVLPQLAWDITFRFQGGALLCKLVKYGQPLGPYLSSYVLTVTALDRYHAICYPLSYCGTTSRQSRVMVYCAWVIALTFCTPQLFVFSYQEVMPGVFDCWATFELSYGEQAYVTWYSFSVFLLPLCVLLYTYTGICMGIWRNSNVDGLTEIGANGSLLEKNQNHFRNRTLLISRARINTLKQTIAVISLYIICSSPFIGCQLWASWDPQASSSPFYSGTTFTIFALLSSLNSCVNPWIYLAFNNELRRTLISRLRQLIRLRLPLMGHSYSPSFNRYGRNSSSSSGSNRPTLTTPVSRYDGSMMLRSSSVRDNKVSRTSETLTS